MTLTYSESQFSRQAPAGEIKSNWWAEPKGSIHKALWPLINALRHEQRHRDHANHMYFNMFLGHGVTGLGGNRYAVKQRHTGRVRANLARSISSAANSKLAKDKIRILYLTEGGNWSQQSRGKRLTKVINGTFHSSGFYEENARAQLDSCVFDLGAVYFYREDDKICAEKVPGCEIRFDAMDARYGKPIQMHREMTVSRSKFLAQYPNKSRIIREAPISESSSRSGGSWIADCIDVACSWHLPSYRGADDGLFAITMPNGTILTEKYEFDYFPFIFHVWEANPLGIYGQSICSQLAGIQHNVNKVVLDVQDHVDLSTGFVAIESGTQFNKQALTNEVWRVCETTGAMPQYITPPAFQMEKVEWLNWLINRGYEDVGLSQLFVTSRKPEGLDSGKALREYNDQNSERFQMIQQRFEMAHVKAAKIIAGLYEQIYKEKGNFPVRAYGSKKIETIDWEAARIDEEDYTIRPVPTSFLPSTPAAKFQTVQEMLQGGLIGREEAMMLLDYPDLERVNSLQIAPLVNIEAAIEIMLDADDPRPATPHPLMNLNLAIQRTQLAYNDAESKGAPQENLDLLDNFIVEANRLLEMQQPQAPGLGPAGPQAPPPAALGPGEMQPPMPQGAPVLPPAMQ